MIVAGWFSIALAGAPSPAGVVRLVQEDRQCAGVVVQGRIHTAYHCVFAASPVHFFMGEQSGKAKVVAVSATRDLAILEPGHPLTSDLELASGPPALGTDSWLIGHPLSVEAPSGLLQDTLRFSVSRGVVSAVGPWVVQTDHVLQPGHSGGPLFDEQGRVVGIVSRRFGLGIGFASRNDEQMPTLTRSPGLGGHVALDISGLLRGYEGYSFGPRLSVALRNRLVASGGVMLPLGARWRAAEANEANWGGSYAALGLRHTVGHGSFAARIDVRAGAMSLMSRTADPARPTNQTTNMVTTPVVGAGIDVKGFGLDGWLDPKTMERILGLSIRKPGRIITF